MGGTQYKNQDSRLTNTVWKVEIRDLGPDPPVRMWVQTTRVKNVKLNISQVSGGLKYCGEEMRETF